MLEVENYLLSERAVIMLVKVEQGCINVAASSTENKMPEGQPRSVVLFLSQIRSR